MSPANFFWVLGAFALALGVLIVVHELGHFLAARLCGVKVLRFSVGFGKTLAMRRAGRDGTEWAIAAFPLGGYVKMLDEREGPVPPEEAHRAFNRQPVGRRVLIVVAGPLANLLLAVLIYWGMFIHGVEEPRPIFGTPPAGSAAAHAGIEDGEIAHAVSGAAVLTWQELRWEVTRRLLDREPVALETANPRGEIAFRNLDASRIDASDPDEDPVRHLGLLPYRPKLKPIVGQVGQGSPAERAGLRAGDEVLAIDGQPVDSWSGMATVIRQSPGTRLALEIRREGRFLELDVTPDAAREKGQAVGRIGIAVREDPALRAAMMVVVRLDPLTALGRAAAQTWETSVFSLRMIGRMIVGELSWKNVSGPVTIADYAGQSARRGLAHYLRFLALISISLGVLNLLPIPILDGGHLLYYLVEAIKGGPLSERVMEIGQQIGLVLLALLMAFAFYNDINRLVSG